MARTPVPRTRCSGEWTEAQYQTFIRNQLRGATWKWKPVSEVLKEARVSKGVYLCAGCSNHVPSSIVVKDKRVKNVFVDHVQPIVDPTVGFVSWDEFINRLFCERDNLQLLCGECHDHKSAEERAVAIERRKKEKNEIN